MVTEHLERKTTTNTIIVDKEKSIEEQIQSLCDQINMIPQVVPFYAGLTAKEIFEELKLLAPITEVEELQNQLINLIGVSFVQVSINYCPMCGGKLGE